MGVKTCKSKPSRVPSRPPPAPPVPPRDPWPAIGYRSPFEYNSGQEAQSEYSEGAPSVRSTPYSTQSLQPNGTQYCTTCSSALSDHEYYSTAVSACCTVQRPRRLPSCCRPACFCGIPHCARTGPSWIRPGASIANQLHTEQLVHNCSHKRCNLHLVHGSCRCQSVSPASTQQSHNQIHKINTISRTDLSIPTQAGTMPPVPMPEPMIALPSTTSATSRSPMQPVPQERKTRPKLSISPMPPLESQDNSADKYRCKPLIYQRHIEQHIERLFKYLSDRQQRSEQCKLSIRLHCSEGGDLKYEETCWTLLAQKENRHLRSLRVRLSPKDFIELKLLGHGVIGCVSLVQKVGTNNYYAMKKLRKSEVVQQNHMAHVIAERDILAEADNEWIVKLYHSFQDERNLYFILEFVPGGDLMNLLMEKRVFTEDWARFYIAEISLAVQVVHDMNFIHRDIKPDNILIDANGHIKLADFGLCTGFRWTHDARYYRDDTNNNAYLHGAAAHQQIDDHPTITKALTQRELEYSKKRRSLSLVGSPNYIAPEVLTRQGTNEKLCDWWSVGVILYEMVVGYCPFINWRLIMDERYSHDLDGPEQVQMRIVNWKDYLRFPDKNNPQAPPRICLLDDKCPGLEVCPNHEISPESRSLMLGWINDASNRLCTNGIQDIINHPFFRNINWHTIRQSKSPLPPDVPANPSDNPNFKTSAQPHLTMEHGTLGANPRINYDFTHTPFWNKPLVGVKTESLA